MQKKIKKHICLIILTFLYFIFLNSFVIVSVQADVFEKTKTAILEEIKAYSDCIMRVESICWDNESVIYCKKSSSGFAISQDVSGVYILTKYDDLTYSENEIKKIKVKNKLEDTARISEKIEVVFSGDLRIQANIVGESEQRNLTVLKLNQSINLEHIFQFSKECALNKDMLFLLSYPLKTDSETEIYNTENVFITSGITGNSFVKDGILFFKHDIQIDDASIGGPLLNENGYVEGIILSSKGEEDGIALSSDAIKAFLDTFNITYEEYIEPIPERKITLVHIILAFMICILLSAILFQNIKNRNKMDNKLDTYNAQTIREDKKNYIQLKSSCKVIDAALEYPAEKRIVIIRKALFVLGRSKDADFIFLESQGISRKHACIEFDGRNFYLSDLLSTNHTFLNGLELSAGEKRVLKDCDEIGIGKEKLIFHLK